METIVWHGGFIETDLTGNCRWVRTSRSGLGQSRFEGTSYYRGGGRPDQAGHVCAFADVAIASICASHNVLVLLPVLVPRAREVDIIAVAADDYDPFRCYRGVKRLGLGCIDEQYWDVQVCLFHVIVNATEVGLFLSDLVCGRC